MTEKTKNNILEDGGENFIETKGFKPGEKVFSVDQMNVIVMPKKFAKNIHIGGNEKTIGIVILSLGFIFLISISVFAYWYFFKYEKNIDPQNETNPSALEEDLNIDDEIIAKKAVVQDPQDSKNEEDLLDDIEVEKEELEEDVDDEDIEEIASSSSEKIVVKTVSTTTEPEVIEEPEAYKDARDSDQDGLSDKEESLLGSSLNAKDSDQDGYDDLSEFLKLYNPSGEGDLMINPGIEEYRNGEHNYKLYYPKSWKSISSNDGESLIFNISNSNFVQVIVQENTVGEDLEDWFKDQFDIMFIESTQTVYKSGWIAYRSNDGLTVYLNRPGQKEIYSISYSVLPGGELSYKNIFEMMLNSFELIK